MQLTVGQMCEGLQGGRFGLLFEGQTGLGTEAGVRLCAQAGLHSSNTQAQAHWAQRLRQQRSHYITLTAHFAHQTCKVQRNSSTELLVRVI